MPASPLDQMTCFSLYAASRAVTQTYRTVLAESGLTYPQFLVLVALSQQDGLSVHELGDVMYLDSGTLSPLLRRIEARGFVTRTRPGGDERVVTVSLTPEGRALQADVATIVECMSPAYGITSRDELDGLLASLHRITDGMTALTDTLRHPDREATPA